MKNCHNKKKKLSTKNLYLLEIYKCTKIKEEECKFSEISTGVYVLGYKSLFDKYEDAFTETEYDSESYYNTIEVGKQRVHVITPIVSNKSEITYEEATSILENHNFYLIDRECGENTKELLEFMKNFNIYSSVEPEKAEDFAKEVLRRINAESVEIKEEVNNNEKGKSYILKRNK